ncbi:hypothetical protein EBR43_01900 [bacterium]|nr:hypothetical protein [bacterium]
MIYRSDKKLFDNIYVSAATYNKSNLIGKEKIRNLATMIRITTPAFRELLNLPDDIIFRMATIRKWWGNYSVRNNAVTITPRLDYRNFLEVVAHELVHAEQFYEGRLVHKGLRSMMWNGKILPYTNSNYEKYRAQPWEQEAYDRQAGIAKEVNKIMNKKYFSNG